DNTLKDSWVFITILIVIEYFKRVLKRRVYLRGAIGYGNFLISKDPLCYIGSVIKQTYDLEKMQEWIGFMLSDDVNKIMLKLIKDLEINNFTMYNIPVKSIIPKNNKIDFKTSLVPDPLLLGYNPEVFDDLHKSLEEIKDDREKESVKRKIFNTMIYFLRVQIPKLSKDDQKFFEKKYPQFF
ncbi:MAG: hypothetical protein ACFFDN_48060, partial [Candidatus Hodarchaeota archaeon]